MRLLAIEFQDSFREGNTTNADNAANAANATNRWRVRCARTDEAVTLADFQEYYGRMLGIQGCEIRLREWEVPETFAMDLVGSKCDEVPTEWPQFDQMYTDPVDLERYYAMLESIVHMERLRAECGVAKVAAPQYTLAEQILLNRREVKRGPVDADEWLKSILQAMGLSDDFDVPQREYDSDLVACIVAPLLFEMRMQEGYKLLVDAEMCRTWMKRLGSSLFPDMAVCRRISLQNWPKTPHTKETLQQILAWYIGTQVKEEWAQLTPWIPTAVTDIAELLAPFRAILPFRKDDPAYITNKRNAVRPPKEVQQTAGLHDILQSVEDRYLFLDESGSNTSNLYFPSYAHWMLFLRHFIYDRSVGVLDFEKCKDMVSERVHEWMSAKQGIRMTGPCPIEKWSVLWTLVVLNRKASASYADRFGLFLSSVDVYDVTRCFKVFPTRYQVEAFLKKWIHVFLEWEIVHDPKKRILVEPMYEVIRRWLGMSLPQSLLKDAPLMRLAIACIEDSPWESVRMTHRRVLKNTTFRNMELIEELMKGFTDVACEQKPVKGRRKKEADAAPAAPPFAAPAPPAPLHPTTTSVGSAESAESAESALQVHLGTL